MSRPLPEPFKLNAGHPALELVNTLDMRFSSEPQELLPAYGDLLRFTVQLRLLTAEQARKLERAANEESARRVLSSVIELREALACLLYGRIDATGPSAAQLKIVERHALEAASHRTLLARGPLYAWDWPKDKTALPLWELAQSAADLLTSDDLERLKACGDPTCRWLFLDTSKNHTRRWCDMKICGNRMKARRHQARLSQRVVD
jgi:predicted RNA-binding Zn ribbon-like protein